MRIVIAAVWLTAIGTIAVALAAVGVALWGDRQTAKRVQAEHDRADRQLAEERKRHDQELASERDRRDKELADERAHSERQTRSRTPLCFMVRARLVCGADRAASIGTVGGRQLSGHVVSLRARRRSCCHVRRVLPSKIIGDGEREVVRH